VIVATVATITSYQSSQPTLVQYASDPMRDMFKTIQKNLPQGGGYQSSIFARSICIMHLCVCVCVDRQDRHTIDTRNAATTNTQRTRAGEVV
jgi:hypothetical protein